MRSAAHVVGVVDGAIRNLADLDLGDVQARRAINFLQERKIDATSAIVLYEAGRMLREGDAQDKFDALLNYWSAFAQARRILIPAMLTRSLPLYGNEMIMMLHATSLASTVTLLETTGVARMITLNYYIQFEPYVTAAPIYLAMTFVLVSAFQLVQWRWAGYPENRIG